MLEWTYCEEHKHGQMVDESGIVAYVNRCGFDRDLPWRFDVRIDELDTITGHRSTLEEAKKAAEAAYRLLNPEPEPKPPYMRVNGVEHDAVLCFASHGMAFFTTQGLDKQWGDDWDDAPYEHNAGYPYTDRESPERWKVFSVFFEGPYILPEEGHRNSPYSVRDINKGNIPWLRYHNWRYDLTGESIPAGTTFIDFCNIMSRNGGRVYCPIEVVTEESK